MNDNDYKKSLFDIINKSDLPDQDKKMWSDLLENAPEEILVIMYSFFLDYSDKIEEATDFLKRKIQAINIKDPAAWNAILKDEESFINKY